MKKIVIPLLFLLPLFSFSQKENNYWMMSGYPATGGNTFIDFNTIQPTIGIVNASYLFFLTNASICDSAGQLLFYTNGKYVANRNHDTLLNSQNYNPGWLTNYYFGGLGLPQGCFIIPRPGYHGQYYLFHESGELVYVDSIQVSQPVKLSYSFIDMSLDNGMGGIVQGKKNLMALYDTLIYGRITGTKHGNGRDWWIVTHRSDSNLIYKTLVTPDTIINTSQNIGSYHRWEKFYEQAVFSPQGDKYGIILTVDKQTLYNVIDLYDFDRCTGLLSNHQSISIPDSFTIATGCSFSPSGRFFYISTPLSLFQYDTWSTNINTSVKLVATPDSIYTPFYFQQLAPDGKIYLSTFQSSTTLHYINNPDLIDTNCNVIQNNFTLPVLNNYAMPNAPNFSLGALQGSPCDTLTAITNLELKDFKLKVFPNPVLSDNYISINYQLPKNKTGLLEVFDITGNMVYKNTLVQWSSIHQFRAYFNTGIYSVVLTADNKRSVVKFVVIDEK
ncbi:MAG TPA: T9SS type A sorting domain-containing protein [Bacteroidia bacterium]|nr:T9SS type A sorting domain-containing protein [Bacteroidia bacterium]HNU34021.1 T9SS type A sorting domain-containing protein [Bacteroidia bacterium]